MRSTQAVFLGLALVAVVVGAWLGWSDAPIIEHAETLVSRPDTEPPAEVTVHVSGWVVSPGVVRVPAGSIVADAIAASGGARPGAALERINLSRLVAEGELIEVPGPGEPSGKPDDGDDGLIAINLADAAELEALPGVGQVLAERIVGYREANGPFETAEDLLDVSGIGEAKLASIRDLITVP